MSQTAAIKVASFNLRHDSFWARRNRWSTRKDLIREMIMNSDAAIIGVQELMPSMREDIAPMLSGYSIFGFGRTKKLTNEQSAILVLDKECKVKFNKTFWLSKRPEKYGSRAFLAAFPRICTVCEVYVNKFHRRVRVFNTHFDHLSYFARNLGARIILEYMHKFNEIDPLPVILMGDLNAKPGSRAIQIFSENLHNYDDIHLTSVYQSFDEQKIHNTYHGFKGLIHSHPIDYIFVSDDFEIDDAHIDTRSVAGAYPSDHYPLVAMLRLKENP